MEIKELLMCSSTTQQSAASLDPFLQQGRFGLVSIGFSWRAVCPKRLGAAKPCRKVNFFLHATQRDEEPESCELDETLDGHRMLSLVRCCADRFIIPLRLGLL